MPKHQSVPASPAALLAQRILDVCITNDDAGIETELKRVLFQTRTVIMGTETTGIESERQELVRAIAESMDRKRNTWAGVVREPRFRVWVDLLRHLSAGDSASSSPTPVGAS
jgi:hypothetical protein